VKNITGKPAIVNTKSIALAGWSVVNLLHLKGERMMKIKWSRALPFFFLLAFLVFPGNLPAADWKLCSENEFLTLYFDLASLNRKDSDRVKVWTKYVPKGKKGKDFWAHVRNFDKIPIKQFKHYAYSVVLYEFCCPEKTYQLISGLDFDQEKKMLSELQPSKSKPIFPESLTETLYQAVCPGER
jgi:Surface-adhesin protein E